MQRDCLSKKLGDSHLRSRSISVVWIYPIAAISARLEGIRFRISRLNEFDIKKAGGDKHKDSTWDFYCILCRGKENKCMVQEGSADVELR